MRKFLPAELYNLTGLSTDAVSVGLWIRGSWYRESA